MSKGKDVLHIVQMLHTRTKIRLTESSIVRRFVRKAYMCVGGVLAQREMEKRRSPLV